jgi:hypothetical protein
MRKMAWIGVLAASAFLACSSGDDGTTTGNDELNENKALGMTDVTILYPRPKSKDFFDDMLGPSSEGDTQGELLPAAIFQQLAPIAAPVMQGPDGKDTDPKRPLFNDWKDSFPNLRIVGIRLDPCFGQTDNLAAPDCMNTIRLVAQFFQPNTNLTVPDGRVGIHLFYQISRADFTALAKSMLDLRKTTSLPLAKGALQNNGSGVHPTLEAEGMRGPFSTALKNLILTYAGEKTLTRIAFCVQDRGATVQYYNAQTDSRWVFGGFDYSYGQLQPLPISTLDYSGLQTIDTAVRNVAGVDRVIIKPTVTVTDNILFALNPKPEANGQVDPAKMTAAQNASYKLQNPTDYTAKTADCASCHMAKQIVPEHGSNDLDYKSYTFRSDHTQDGVGPFRMFGYDSNGNPIVSRRVVNETAVVLDYLNTVVLK